MKTCSKCGVEKPLSDFYVQREKRTKNPVYARPSCKECDRARIHARRQAHLEEHRARDRAYAAARPTGFHATRAREYYSRNRAAIISYQLWRHAMKRAPSGERIKRDAIFERDGGRCRMCGCDLTVLPVWHLDHIVPLALGGTHEWANLQALCRPCNSSKGARLEGQIALPV